MGVLPAPGGLELGQSHEAGFLCWSGVDRAQGAGNLLAVLPGHLRQRVPDLVNEATLDFGLGIHGSDGFRKACQAIHGENQHVVYAPVFELIEHAEPVLGGFALAKPDAETLLFPLQIDADHQVGGHVLDPAIHPELEEQRIHEHDSVNRLQRPVLPFLGLVDDGIGDAADRLG